MRTIEHTTTPRCGTGIAALCLSLGLGAVLNSCAVPDEPSGSSAAAQPTSTTTVSGTGSNATLQDAGTSTDPIADPVTTSTTWSKGEQVEGTEAPSTASNAALPTAAGAAAEDAAAEGASSDAGRRVADVVPTKRPLPPRSTTGVLVPPGFSTADSILMEDAFDGPDLRLKEVTTAIGDPHEVVFVLDGTGFPGWQVEYVDSASATVSSTMRVRLVGVDAGTVPAELPTSPELDVETGETADSDLSVLVRLDQGPAPFRVHLQHAPLRIVMQIMNEE